MWRSGTGMRMGSSMADLAEVVAPGLYEWRHQALGIVEAGADHGPAGSPGGDALADDGELEEGDGLVPGGVRDVEAGLLRVALDHIVARREPRGRSDRRDDARRI